MAKEKVTPVTSHPELFLSIGDDKDIGFIFEKFEWQAFTNGGYFVRGRIRDSYWNIMKQFVRTDEYLDQGRRKPTRVVWELKWPGAGRTGKHLGYLTDIYAVGINTGGGFEFVAVDPPSYWLNAGDASGDVYEGSVKEVIEQVLQRYWVGPNDGIGKFEVSKTLDNVKNKWWMMRMDPKTFIGTLLDWASSVTEKKSNFIVSSDGALERGVPTIWIKEQAVRPSINYGTWFFNTKAPAAGDGYSFEFLSNTYISLFQRQLITSGMSAVTERYFDRIIDKPRQIVHVYDELTPTKKNVNIKSHQGFKKPGSPVSAFEQPHEWATSVIMIPQHNAGDIGIPYDKYIDGRARTMFLNMLNLVMRVKIRVTGEPLPELADSHNLGVSKLKIAWRDAEFDEFFIDGDWLVYGYHHMMTRGEWYTDLYLARLDYDAEAIKV
jgi:hypothetical protein